MSGNNTITLDDILIGEVWVCSGQSNMEMSANWGIENGERAIAEAQDGGIRFFTAPKISATSPQNHTMAIWETCSREVMKRSSAIGYFFAQRLRERLKGVPIGIVVSAWGGTPAEIWIPEKVVKGDPVLLKAAMALKEVPWGPREPGRAFNGMISPLVGYGIAGVLWYQGESNVGSLSYDKTLAALIQAWRALWKKEFPFYFVQIAPYAYGDEQQGGAIIRDAQRKVLDLVANTAMVVTSDISTIDDIHPKNKRDVGLRLANLSLANHYEVLDTEVNGPLFKGADITDDLVTVHFDYSQGLYFKNGRSVLFEIAGTDGIYYQAKAVIREGSVRLRSSKVKHPTRVRYAWGNTALADLFNGDDLPASTFSFQ
jgi:sialate O-acetylesterase